ncbi:MAG: polysaccharide deacetylase family protein, partial [bacterium]
MNTFTAQPPTSGPPVRPVKKGPWMSRPIQALKDQYVQAWLYFLLIVSIVVAWWFPLRVLYNRYRFTPVVSEIQRDAESFVALTYAGVSDRTNEVSPAQFDEHLKALRDRGYIPIGLTDVQGLLYHNRPLPRRAVLVTFEQSRKSSYFETRDILRRRRWNAVMFLWTKPISDEEPSSLRWPYVKDMAYSGTWEIGAESDNGFIQVPADAKGRTGNFMTTPMWLTEGQRYETPVEYESRLSGDLAANFNMIFKETGHKPIAYAFPYGDFGQYDSRAVLTRRINLDLVGQRYALGFVSGDMALNTRFSDPRRLNRLLVQPSWSGAELAAMLEHTWPIITGFENVTALGNETAWITDWGRSAFGTNGILLRSTPTTTGAKMWLAGSNLCRDFQMRLRFMPIDGQFGVFLRATPDEESYLYIGLEAGNAWLRQKFQSLEPFTLASARATVRAGEV